jgi:spore germination protein KA
MYIDKIARKDIVDEIRLRLNKIKIDAILDSGNIEELIRDDRYSIFRNYYTQKNLILLLQISWRKSCHFCRWKPYVLTAPALFVEFLQVSEDYYTIFWFLYSSDIKVWCCFSYAFCSGRYISLITFHQEMIPTPLLISISSQRESVPFPALIEAILMEGVFEILREAGIRMPRVIGPAISIVGALVLGQAAVEAGIVSAFMVIIVSITAISSFAIPNYSLANALRIIRFVLMLLAGMYGLYGVFMGFMALILHLCKLKSMGIPYMIPIAPKTKYAAKDTIIRYPLWSIKRGLPESAVKPAKGRCGII